MLNLIKNSKDPRQRKHQFVLYECDERAKQRAGEFRVSQSKRPNEIYMCKKIYNTHFNVFFFFRFVFCWLGFTGAQKTSLAKELLIVIVCDVYLSENAFSKKIKQKRKKKQMKKRNSICNMFGVAIIMRLRFIVDIRNQRIYSMPFVFRTQ